MKMPLYSRAGVVCHETEKEIISTTLESRGSAAHTGWSCCRCKFIRCSNASGIGNARRVRACVDNVPNNLRENKSETRERAGGEITLTYRVVEVESVITCTFDHEEIVL
jgi:hypothetical protein